MTDETRVEPTPRVPLPRGPEHAAYIVDATPVRWLRNVWPGGKAPYNYSGAGQILRLSMPARSWIKYEPLMKRLTDRVTRMRAYGDLPANFDEVGWTDEECAMCVLATALMERGTTFYVLNVQPSGRTWGFFRGRRMAAWHPDALRPRGGR
ncbi:hypothetical protein QI633_09620 [Nocardioides sp. QY071]|uniref:hypothetical protein n=1 Tax=Nocardioides sp. QY071 TaxID=3044187 RepID=UPI00249AB235|nr:hypothetical protein [Nocardioides sp. QY071]WGY04011.1 hypothetical protein QI633_09620 [Nocardioides sp. QY071]